MYHTTCSCTKMFVTFYSAPLLGIVYRDTEHDACSGDVTMNMCKYKLTIK